MHKTEGEIYIMPSTEWSHEWLGASASMREYALTLLTDKSPTLIAKTGGDLLFK